MKYFLFETYYVYSIVGYSRMVELPARGVHVVNTCGPWALIYTSFSISEKRI